MASSSALVSELYGVTMAFNDAGGGAGGTGGTGGNGGASQGRAIRALLVMIEIGADTQRTR